MINLTQSEINSQHADRMAKIARSLVKGRVTLFIHNINQELIVHGYKVKYQKFIYTRHRHLIGANASVQYENNLPFTTYLEFPPYKPPQ